MTQWGVTGLTWIVAQHMYLQATTNQETVANSKIDWTTCLNLLEVNDSTIDQFFYDS